MTGSDGAPRATAFLLATLCLCVAVAVGAAGWTLVTTALGVGVLLACTAFLFPSDVSGSRGRAHRAAFAFAVPLLWSLAAMVTFWFTGRVPRRAVAPKP